MKIVAQSDQELSVEERNLLSVAYKNVIGARRASWRIVTSIEQKEESKGNEAQVALIKEYRQKIEKELTEICEDILGVLDKHLISSAQTGESKVFYHKMYVRRSDSRRHWLIKFVGRVTTTATWPSSPWANGVRCRPMLLSRLTRPRLRSRRRIWRRRTRSAWVWR